MVTSWQAGDITGDMGARRTTIVSRRADDAWAGPYCAIDPTALNRRHAAPPPLNLISIPKIEQQQPLPQKYNYACLLGFLTLPDDVKSNVAHIIAIMVATKDVVQGHTAQRVAAELKRCAKKLRREQQTGRPDARVRRLLADPHFGLDMESFDLLQPLTAAPTLSCSPPLKPACNRSRRCGGSIRNGVPW
jgi:hypothetical protein